MYGSVIFKVGSNLWVEFRSTRNGKTSVTVNLNSVHTFCDENKSFVMKIRSFQNLFHL